EGGITILAGDFNTNLDPHRNRISRSPPSNDPTRKLFSDLTAEYIDTALATACAKPFITYHQNIRAFITPEPKAISEEEVGNIINQLPNNKSPGSDGLTYEFYKGIKEEIVPILTSLFNYQLGNGLVSRTWTKSIITLIPKKSNNLENIDNWINTICESIIGPSQQAFIKRRSIMDAALDIITTMRNQVDQSASHWLLLLDQQKAFDRISHDFILLVLERMGFDTMFINIIKNLFKLQTAHIADSNLISEPIRVERGVRQGDTLSPLL
ncbi:12097_t:CDS:2, partial [Gigaspora rosea]